MNTQLVESLIQVIKSLSEEEKFLFNQKLAETISYPSAKEIENLAQIGGAFNFLYDEPDIYTLKDGEAIKWD